MPYPQHVKDIAYKLDPECWASYSGKPKSHKSYMDSRRTASLNRATELHEQQRDRNEGDNDAHYLGAIKLRLERLYDLEDDPRTREQISDEVDWVNAKLETA